MTKRKTQQVLRTTFSHIKNMPILLETRQVYFDDVSVFIVNLLTPTYLNFLLTNICEDVITFLAIKAGFNGHSFTCGKMSSFLAMT